MGRKLLFLQQSFEPIIVGELARRVGTDPPILGLPLLEKDAPKAASRVGTFVILAALGQGFGLEDQSGLLEEMCLWYVDFHPSTHSGP